jgi:hypothetical protein
MTSPAPGSAADQVGLVSCLERYERAERLAQWLPQVSDLGTEANKRHERLWEAALRCGFSPGREHSHQTCLEFARRRASVLRVVMPNHLEGK